MNDVGDVGRDALWHYELHDTQCYRINRHLQAEGQSITHKKNKEYVDEGHIT